MYAKSYNSLKAYKHLCISSTSFVHAISDIPKINTDRTTNIHKIYLEIELDKQKSINGIMKTGALIKRIICECELFCPIVLLIYKASHTKF